MDLKSLIGQKLGPYPEKADPKRIQDFQKTVCSTVHGDWEVPPTFMTVCRQGEFDWVDRLGFEISEVLHGEQEYEYVHPVRLGEEVVYETTLTNLMEKRSSKGVMIFLIMATEIFEKKNHRLCVRSKTTFIIRRAA